MDERVVLMVNGQAHALAVRRDAALLNALRKASRWTGRSSRC
jgi:aerobic-type carbon monoxide dehydrogenase small subunit (CoxS/CutS family)